jgi:hypothetical protein
MPISLGARRGVERITKAGKKTITKSNQRITIKEMGPIIRVIKRMGKRNS